MNRVLVVDDHTVIRRGIQNILRAWPEWEISGEASSGEEAIELTKELKPDIVLMDISMPGMGGLEATKLILKIYPQAKILLLTLHDSPEWAETALRAGARGYVLKSDSEGELLRALKVVATNGVCAYAKGLDCLTPGGRRSHGPQNVCILVPQLSTSHGFACDLYLLDKRHF